MNKYISKEDEYRRIVEELHECSIAVLGTFMLDLVGDAIESIRELPHLIKQTKIDVPRYVILTPYPTTSLFNGLETDERILHRDWSKYDSIHCVFQPKNMTVSELELEHIKVWKDTYIYEKIFNRLRFTPQRKGTALITNIGFKIYARRLEGLI